MKSTGTCLVTSKYTETITLGAASAQIGPVGLPPTQYSYPYGTSTGGTVASVIDLHYESAEITLASGASQTFTLSALTDAAGRAVAFARIREFLLWIKTKANAADRLDVGNAAAAPWDQLCSDVTKLVSVKDLLLHVDTSPAGMPVGSGTADQVKITNAGTGNITFQLFLKGCST